MGMEISTGTIRDGEVSEGGGRKMGNMRINSIIVKIN